MSTVGLIKFWMYLSLENSKLRSWFKLVVAISLVPMSRRGIVVLIEPRNGSSADFWIDGTEVIPEGEEMVASIFWLKPSVESHPLLINNKKKNMY
jgi:hypothetical protein